MYGFCNVVNCIVLHFSKLKNLQCSVVWCTFLYGKGPTPPNAPSYQHKNQHCTNYVSPGLYCMALYQNSSILYINFTNSVQIVYQHCTNTLPTLYQHSTNTVPTLMICTNTLPTLYQHCSNTVPTLMICPNTLATLYQYCTNTDDLHQHCNSTQPTLNCTNTEPTLHLTVPPLKH